MILVVLILLDLVSWQWNALHVLTLPKIFLITGARVHPTSCMWAESISLPFLILYIAGCILFFWWWMPTLNWNSKTRVYLICIWLQGGHTLLRIQSFTPIWKGIQDIKQRYMWSIITLTIAALMFSFNCRAIHVQQSIKLFWMPMSQKKAI